MEGNAEPLISKPRRKKGRKPLWREARTEDGRIYYYNRNTKRTSWTKPHESSSRSPPTRADRAVASKTRSARSSTAETRAEREADDVNLALGLSESLVHSSAPGRPASSVPSSSTQANDAAIALALAEEEAADRTEVAAFRPSPYPGGRRGAALSLALSLSARPQTPEGPAGDAAPAAGADDDANDFAISAALAAMEVEPDFLLDASALESVPRAEQPRLVPTRATRATTRARFAAEADPMVDPKADPKAAATSKAPGRPGLQRTATCRGLSPARTEEKAAPLPPPECAICLQAIESPPRCESPKGALALPCMHVFHRDCARTWLKQSSACPVCKTPVRADQRPL